MVRVCFMVVKYMELTEIGILVAKIYNFAEKSVKIILKCTC